MFFIKNRLVVKILTVLTVLLLFFSFGLFLSDITSDVKVDSVVIDYEPVHSLSSLDNLYYGTVNYVDDEYLTIGGDTNFLLVDLLSYQNFMGLVFEEVLGSTSSGELSSYFDFLYYVFDYYQTTDLNTGEDSDVLYFGIDIYGNDYDVLAYSGFSFDLSLFDSSSAYIYVGVPYDGTVLNSKSEAWDYALDKEIIYSDVATFYFNPFISYEGDFVISIESAYDLGYLKTQGTGIVEVVTSVFPLGLGILNAISSYFTALFFSNGSLSNFAIFSFVLVGISLVMGLTYVIYHFVKRKR